MIAQDTDPTQLEFDDRTHTHRTFASYTVTMLPSDSANTVHLLRQLCLMPHHTIADLPHPFNLPCLTSIPILLLIIFLLLRIRHNDAALLCWQCGCRTASTTSAACSATTTRPTAAAALRLFLSPHSMLADVVSSSPGNCRDRLGNEAFKSCFGVPAAPFLKYHRTEDLRTTHCQRPDATCRHRAHAAAQHT